MAAKEERILISSTKKGQPVLAFPRSEAIERMAKAIFTEIWGLPNNRFDLAKFSVKVINLKLAEAALNSLLEDK